MLRHIRISRSNKRPQSRKLTEITEIQMPLNYITISAEFATTTSGSLHFPTIAEKLVRKSRYKGQTSGWSRAKETPAVSQGVCRMIFCPARRSFAHSAGDCRSEKSNRVVCSSLNLSFGFWDVTKTGGKVVSSRAMAKALPASCIMTGRIYNRGYRSRGTNTTDISVERSICCSRNAPSDI